MPKDKMNKSEFLKFDITNSEETIKAVSTIKPDIIVHAASIGNVDYCEANKDIAFHINIVGTNNLLMAAKKTNTKLVFISSSYVYKGNQLQYSEKDVTPPVNYYGSTKLQAEQLVKNSGLKYMIIRPTTMYGWNYHSSRKNLLTYFLSLDKSLKNTKLASNFISKKRITNFLYAKDAAESLWKIIEKEFNYKTFNIGGQL